MLRSRAFGLLLFAAVLLSSFGYAAVSDRVVGNLVAGPKVQLRGNVHGLARPEFDLGRADGSRLIEGITLSFRPSPAQQQDLNQFLAQLGDPHSKNFHKYLTPAQFGERFGMSQSDIAKISGWLQQEGFTNISVANGRNQISFDGTVGQIESAFALEMHNYAVKGELHLANAGEPSVPAALSGIVGSLWHIDDFSPKPRISVKPNLTSYVSGNHFLTPGDIAKIYNLGTLYTAGGTGQSIAIIGQTTVNTTDLNSFRTAAGLPASTVTMTLAGGTGTRCPGDEGESDLDIEWAGGVAQNASVNFVFAGLGTGETCTNRTNNVWNALQYAIQHNVAPFISTSYGFCESGLGQAFVVNTLQPLLQQGQTQGQTLVAASGDSGAADCEPSGSTSATTGLAVDAPSSIPEATGAGGTEFTGDTPGTVTGTAPNTTAGADNPYWGASGTGSDGLVTALTYIPEITWNDTNNVNNTPPTLSAAGGGASIYFAKPSWQTGTGVPPDSARDVPDIALTTSQFHDSYLICSEDTGTATTQTTCTAGFRTGAGGNFSAVGGTSAAAPTFAAILALINQFVGNYGTTGLAPINPTLYSIAASTPAAFHDVTQGTNKVPCTTGSTGCPSGTTQIGFSAGTGYDQITGLGSVDVTNLANAWNAALVTFDVTAGALSPASVPSGGSTAATITITPQNGFSGTVSFSCSGLPTGTTCSFSPATVSNATGTTQLTIQTSSTSPLGTSTVTVIGTSGIISRPSTLSLTVIAPFTMSAGAFNPAPTPAGESTSSTITVTPQNGFNGTITLSCSGLPSGATPCTFNPATVSLASGSATTQMTIQTAGNWASGPIPVTVTGSSAGGSSSTTVSLMVAKTNMTFSLATNLSGGTATVAQGQTTGAINIAVTSTSTPSFLGTNGGGQTVTSLPVTYSCSGNPAQSICLFNGNSQSLTTQSTTVTLTISTTAPTGKLQSPLGHESGILYAVLLPGLLGIAFTVGSRRRSLGSMLGVILLLGVSSLWMASCGGTNGSGTKNLGTVVGSYPVVVNATTGGAAPITSSVQFTLNVTP